MNMKLTKIILWSVDDYKFDSLMKGYNINYYIKELLCLKKLKKCF